MKEEIRHLEELLATYQKGLHHLEIQRATYGASSVPVQVSSDIQYFEKEIKRTKRRLYYLRRKTKISSKTLDDEIINKEESDTYEIHSTSKTIHNDVNIKVHTNREESYQTMLNEINNARDSIDIVSHFDLLAADTRRTVFYETLRSAVGFRKVNHQRIIWNADHIIWLEQMLDNGWDYYPEFSVRFYVPNQRTINICTFDLIDHRAVIFMQGWSIQGSTLVTLPQMVQSFHEYFTSLWTSSEWIKRRGRHADREKLREIAKGL